MTDPDIERQNALHSTLAHPRRRLVLYHLNHAESMQSLPDLAEYVAAQESHRNVSEIDEESARDVYVSLYHAHIPVLEEASLVQYDQQDDLVELEEYPVDFIDEDALETGR